MERITSINPKRILWSCEERGVDLSQLADAVQISKRTLDHALEADEGLTFAQLQRLAKYFHRGVLFFLEPGEPQEDQVYSPQFRTLANQKAQITPKIRAIIQQAERQREVFLGLREELGEPIEQEFEPPSTSVEDIPRSAETIRQWLGLKDENTFETYRAAVESKGVLVFRSQGYDGAWRIPKEDRVDGFCLYNKICPVIVVRKRRSEGRQAFTLFHEVAHLILHRVSSFSRIDDTNQDSITEREANSFAAHLLVPERFLQRIELRFKPVEAKAFDQWLQPEANAWTVSPEVIVLRLLETGRLNRREYDSYRLWKDEEPRSEDGKGNRKYRHREPLHVFGPTFTRTVLEALSRQQITSNKASRYLDNLKLQDLRQLEEYVATH
jgi:Zn-dependent peptidase ImmA (M78 family)